MQLLVNLVIIILLAVIVFQDFRQREISWFLLPLLFTGFALRGLFVLPFNVLFQYGFFNILFLLVQFAGLIIYYSVKNKKLVNIIDSQIGLGDLLFFIVMCMAFAPVNFIFFYITGMLITLIGFLLYSIKKTLKDIPLAGSLAGILIALLLFNICFPALNLYSDNEFSRLLLKI